MIALASSVSGTEIPIIKSMASKNLIRPAKDEAGVAKIAEVDFLVTMMDEHKISIKESLQKEKQIVVDPLSLKGSSTKQGFFGTAQPTVSTTLAATDLHLPPLQPPKQNFLSLSLPNSASSSPQFTSTTLLKKKSIGESLESPHQASNLTSKDQHLLQGINIRRSKSCGEGRGRLSSDEFDLWLTKPTAVEHDNRSRVSFSKTEADNESSISGMEPETPADEGFKCSALCLYLPGFGKAKAIKARKEESEMEGVISRTVSLEKFKCGSWASSALFHEIEGGDPMNSSYFDLPMELINCSANDVHAPVTSAFVFEKDLKGVLKNGSARASARKTKASPRHVRFSTSSPTSHPASPASCIVPPLRKAIEDFNTFLEAQSA